MSTEYESSTSTMEKLTLIVLIAAVVIGNVSLCAGRKGSNAENSFLAVRLRHLHGSGRWQALVEHVRLRNGLYRSVHRGICSSDAFHQCLRNSLDLEAVCRVDHWRIVCDSSGDLRHSDDDLHAFL